METRGGVRQGAGRPKTSVKQISVRVPEHTTEAMKAFSGGTDISSTVRQMADFSASMNLCIDEKSKVWARFCLFEEIEAPTVDAAFNRLVVFIKDKLCPTSIYSCGRDLHTVKGRLALGNDSSVWFYVASQRTASPSNEEFYEDKQKIMRTLKNLGLEVKW